MNPKQALIENKIQAGIEVLYTHGDASAYRATITETTINGYILSDGSYIPHTALIDVILEDSNE